jgi:hypothetical protein
MRVIAKDVRRLPLVWLSILTAQLRPRYLH